MVPLSDEPKRGSNCVRTEDAEANEINDTKKKIGTETVTDGCEEEPFLPVGPRPDQSLLYLRLCAADRRNKIVVVRELLPSRAFPVDGEGAGHLNMFIYSESESV